VYKDDYSLRIIKPYLQLSATENPTFFANG